MEPDAVSKKRFRSRGTHQERKERQRLKQQGANPGPPDAVISSAMPAACGYRSRIFEIDAMLNLKPASYQRNARSDVQYNTILDLLAKKAQGRYVDRELRDADMKFWLAHGGDEPFPENPNDPKDSVFVPRQTPADFEYVRRAQASLSEQDDLAKSFSSVTKVLQHNGHRFQSARSTSDSLNGGMKFNIQSKNSPASSADPWGQVPEVSQVGEEKDSNHTVEKAVPKDSALEATPGAEVTDQEILTCALSAVILGVMDTVIERAGFKVPGALANMHQEVEDSQKTTYHAATVEQATEVQQRLISGNETPWHLQDIRNEKELEVMPVQQKKNSKASKRTKYSLSEFMEAKTSELAPQMDNSKTGLQANKNGNFKQRGPSQRFADLRGSNALVPSNVNKPDVNVGWTAISSTAPWEIVEPGGRPRSHVLKDSSANDLNSSPPLTFKSPPAATGIAAWKSLPSRIAADDKATFLASRNAARNPNAKLPVIKETYKKVVISEGDYSRKIVGKSIKVIE